MLDAEAEDIEKCFAYWLRHCLMFELIDPKNKESLLRAKMRLEEEIAAKTQQLKGERGPTSDAERLVEEVSEELLPTAASADRLSEQELLELRKVDLEIIQAMLAAMDAQES